VYKLILLPSCVRRGLRLAIGESLESVQVFSECSSTHVGGFLDCY
jgi:hypothetical protein